MRFSKEVRRNIAFIALGTAVLLGIMLGIFALCGRFSLAVLWGGLIGSALAVLNFFLLAVSLEKAVASPSKVSWIAGFSYSGRVLMLFLLAIAAIALGKANPVSVLIPYIFPRVTIAVLQIFGAYKTEKSIAGQGGNTHGG